MPLRPVHHHHHRHHTPRQSPLSDLAAGDDNLVLHTISQYLDNWELYTGPLRASRRQCQVAKGSLDPSADDNIAIFRAIELNDAGCLASLLRDARVNIAACGSEALSAAVAHNRTDAVRILLQDGRSDPTASDGKILCEAIRYGYADIVHLLLQDGRIDPSARDNEALFAAVFHNHNCALQLLLVDGRADPTARGGILISRAIMMDRIESVRLLLQDGRLDPAANGSHSFPFAIARKNIRAVRLLLQDGRARPGPHVEELVQLAKQHSDDELISMLIGGQNVAAASARVPCTAVQSRRRYCPNDVSDSGNRKRARIKMGAGHARPGVD